MSIDRSESDVIQSLVRGLSVITALNGATAGLTLSEVSRKTDMTRASSRRILLTLESIGYVRKRDTRFSLTPLTLELGYAYLSSLGAWQVCRPRMEDLSDALGESVSVGTLDGNKVAYVARVPAQRIMTRSPNIGTRIPAAPSSMGRVLLAQLDTGQLENILRQRPIKAFTERTVTDPDELLDILAEVKSTGWSFVEGELETGMRAVAVPLRGSGGEVVAALNVGLYASPVTNDEVVNEILPRLVQTAEQISNDLRRLDATQRTVNSSSF